MEYILAAIIIIALGIIVGQTFAIHSLRGKLSSIPDNEAAAKENERRIKAYEESADRLLEHTRRQYERQIELLEQRLERQGEELRQKSAMEFSHLADRILEERSKNLNEHNRNDINSILSPLKDNIEEFKKAVRESYMKENSTREALSLQIDNLVRANGEISLETRRLSDALKGNAAVQGRWGEIVLETILEKAGMLKDVHFLTQTAKLDGCTLKDDDGRGQRPDVILLLPGEHKMVIDSKTSLSAYLRAMEASEPATVEKEMKQHLAATKLHVEELASKQYHKYIGGALEHTIMFIPNDAAYIAAMHADAGLGEYALKKNIVIVSPAHVLSVVQLVNQIWRIENQNKNAENIAKLGGLLYDKIVAFISDFESIDRNLKASAKAYDKCLAHLSSGGSSLLRRSERLREMGAKTTKRIPDHLLPPDDIPQT